MRDEVRILASRISSRKSHGGLPGGFIGGAGGALEPGATGVTGQIVGGLITGAAYDGRIPGVESEPGDAIGTGGRADVLDAAAPYPPLRPRLSSFRVNRLPDVGPAPVPAVGDEKFVIDVGPPRAGIVIVVSSEGRRTRIESGNGGSGPPPPADGAIEPAALRAVDDVPYPTFPVLLSLGAEPNDSGADWLGSFCPAVPARLNRHPVAASVCNATSPSAQITFARFRPIGSNPLSRLHSTALARE